VEQAEFEFATDRGGHGREQARRVIESFAVSAGHEVACYLYEADLAGSA